MHAHMMQQPLLISSLLAHAERHHSEATVLSRRVEGDLHRCTYAELAERCRRLANTLCDMQVASGQRVGTLAWNGYRHLELYYAISGIGAVTHTLNPRLHPDQLAWIINDAADDVLFIDLTFLPLVESVQSQLRTVRKFVLLTDRGHMPRESSIEGLLCYEELLSNASASFSWPEFDENTASGLCYTSGTTGHPKGVLYTHRSTLLHSFAGALPDVFGCSAKDTILPAVPMFHVNAWGLPYMALMVGANLVLPGPSLDGHSLYELLASERVTLACGVPTVWQGLLAHVAKKEGHLGSLQRIGIGGSACPPSMIRDFQETHGVQVIHAWGMTETSPVVTAAIPKAKHIAAQVSLHQLQCKQGRALFGTDIKVVDGKGAELPHDGKSAGELMVRGHWVLSRYFGSEASALVDGWFPTGDIATVDADRYVQITDRLKDVIKSGGEWISSIELENAAIGHPAVAMAACIGIPDPKWGERPLLVIVRRPGAQLTRQDVLQFLDGKVPRWWMPEEVKFVEEIPLGATGKMQKHSLREQLVQVPATTGVTPRN